MVVEAACGQATTNPAAKANAPKYQVPRTRDDAGLVVGPARAGWWNDAVFYEIFVRSFQDSESGPLANDGIGDIPGLISRLDYLNDGDPATDTDLGVTGIWLMPIHPSPSYHGYDITDYRNVNPQYGTLDDMRRLVQECHKRGIRIILDLVINHTSNRHPWFLDAANAGSAHRNWYIWSDSDPAYKGLWGQTVWHRTRGGAGDKPQFYFGMFSPEMPDLNCKDAGVTAELLDITRFWLDRNDPGIAVDGYRLDAIRHLIEEGRQHENTLATHTWLEEFYRTYKKVNPDAVSIGEVWSSSDIVSSYVGNQMDLCFEFDLSFAMVAAAKTGKAAPVIEAQERVLRCYPPNQYGRFLTNHDQTRVATELGGDQDKMRTAAALMMLGPGVPFMYYAEEVGQLGAKPDPDLRTPMPWDDSGAGFTKGKPWKERTASPAGTNVAAEAAKPNSLLNFYRRLSHLRGRTPALSSGGYVGLSCSDPGVYAFLRTGEKDDHALVVINLSDKRLSDVEAGVARSPLKKTWQGADQLGSSVRITVEGSADLGAVTGLKLGTLKPHEVRVFTLSPGR